MPGWVIDNKVFGVTIPYAEFIRKYGQLVILTPDEPVRDDLDLLVLPGGADVAPHKHTNSKLSMYTGSSNAMLEYFDNKILPQYIESKQSILTICRGSQLIWSYFGGEIIQHFPNHTQSDYPTDQCHPVIYNEGYKHYKKLLSHVNSRHHQVMSTNNLPEELEVIAYAGEEFNDKLYVLNNVVEIYQHKTLPIMGYQGHPEDMPDDKLTDLFIEHLFKVNKK